ncbi:MAG: hypothetical protein SFT90_05185 [Rickettsiales bacterium]|nr:hypothetical protein [Rickettsiales bacterium]
MSEKKPGIMLPTASDDAPLRNFLILLLLIPIAPLLMVYSIVTGRLQNPFIVGACLTMILIFGTYYVAQKHFTSKPTRKEKIFSLVEEIELQERHNLRKKISTIRKSIGVQGFPKQLKPMFDIEQDMLTINYYYHLRQAGYLGSNAEGAVYVLQNALYSSRKDLAKAAWDCLTLINTPEAITAKEIFLRDYQKIQQASKQNLVEEDKRQKFYQKYKEKERTQVDDIKDSLKDKFLNFKNNW